MENIVINPQKTITPPAAPAIVAVPQVEADLDVLIQSGVIERVVAPFEEDKLRNCRVTMHTLLNPERVSVSKEIPNEEVSTLSVAEQAPKIPTLVYAITCIEMSGNKHMFDTAESKPALRSMLNRMSAVMVDMLYLEYLKMTSDLIKVIETGVKKN